MLGAVVLEQAPQVAAGATSSRQVAEEDRGAQQPSTSQNSTAEPSRPLIRLVRHDRDDEEQADGERERGDDRERPRAPW